MCGIAAIFAYHLHASSVDSEELVRIRDAMTIRGPDGSGEWINADRRVGLAHRRLSIIDLSANGAQPMGIEDNEFQIVFNGEIYNYQELRQSLEKRGHRFFSQGDTEVILRLYADQGLSALEQLRGMYAFALWDNRKKGMLLARDPLGIKPLFYADDGKTLRVASQVRALRASAHVSNEIDPAGAVGFYLLGSVPDPFTLFKSIRSLPAGHTLWVPQEDCPENPRSYYSLPFDQPVSHNMPSSSLRESLLETVRYHLVADVPVGVFLSAGLDSATLTALSAEIIPPENLHTVTLGFEELKGTPADEVPLAEKVAAYYGTRQHTKFFSRRDFEAELPRIFQSMDQPSIDGVNTYFVSKVAHEVGLKVALSGVGGDELFGSYPSFRQIPRLVQFLRPASHVAGFSKTLSFVTKNFPALFGSPKAAGLAEYGASVAGAYFLRRALFMPQELNSLLTPDFVNEGLKRLGFSARLKETISGIPNIHWQISALEISWYMRNQLLRDSDWAGMAHSLEIRLPFVDWVFVKKIYEKNKGFAPGPKHNIGLAPTKALPAEVLNKPKTGFTIPVAQWIAGDNPKAVGLRPWARRVYEQAIA